MRTHQNEVRSGTTQHCGHYAANACTLLGIDVLPGYWSRVARCQSGQLYVKAAALLNSEVIV